MSFFAGSQKKRKLLLISLLAIQQLCLCFWLCNLLHAHPADEAPVTAWNLLEAAAETESTHLDACDRDTLQQTRTKVSLNLPLPDLAPPPQTFPAPWGEPLYRFDHSNPTGSGPPLKRFLQFQIFRC